jgi:hypothetical protein
MRKGYLPGGVGIWAVELALCVLLLLCGRGRAGAGGVGIVLSEAVEMGEVISEARGVW